MKTFKQFLEDLFEAKHYVDADEHERLINLHHSEVSKTNGHNNYEDRVGHAVKKTTLSSHSPEVVKRVLDNFSQGSNTWVRRKAAEHPDLHHPDHAEILDRLMNDPSGKVRELAAAERKGEKSVKIQKSTAAPKKPASSAAFGSNQPKPSPEAKKEAPAPKAAKAKAKPAPTSEPSSGGGYSTVAGETGDMVRRRTHVTHGGKHIGTVETNKNGISRLLTSHGGMIASTRIPDHEEGIATAKHWHAKKELDSVDSPIRHKK